MVKVTCLPSTVRVNGPGSTNFAQANRVAALLKGSLLR